MTSSSGSTERPARERLLELARFAVVGGLSTVLYFGSYSGFVLLGLPYGVASFLGWACSVAMGYVLHHRFTFRTGEDVLGGAGLGRWVALQTVVLLANFGGLSLLVHQFELSRILSQLLLLPLIPLLTYVLSRRFVFASPEVDASGSEPVRFK